MNITFAPRGILQIDDARITHRNFEGRGSQYNREGDRNFSVVIPHRALTREEVDNILDIYLDAELVTGEDGNEVLMYNGDEIITLKDALVAMGWRVKVKPPRDVDEDPFIYLPVKVNFNNRGPVVFLKSGAKTNRLDEEHIGCLDKIDILNVDLDIRPYNWTVNGNIGQKAYLQGMAVTQEVDRFMERYYDQELY